jgi:selenocysteine-specific translation elongation factor
MTSPLELSSEILASSVMEDTVVGDAAVIAAATNHAAVEALAEEIAAEASHAAATVAATSTATLEEKEEEEIAMAKKKRRVTGEKRTRRVGIPSPRKDAKLEDPSQASRDDHAYKVQSKHDEKWNKMLEALAEYKKEHNSTMVPQCYDQDQRLGRWVHYQRVEYWIYQTSGKGKINADRIARLEALGFEVRTVGITGSLAVFCFRGGR